MGIGKILAHDIRIQKNPQTKDNTFLLIFTDFHGVMRVQNPTYTLARKLHE